MKECGDIYETFNEKQIWSESVDRPDHQFKNWTGALNSIAERNKISPQYLEQVFASLRKAGIVKSIKGSQGGYFLSRPPQEITVSSIIEALEGDYRIEDEELPKEGKYTGSVKAIQKLVIDRVNDSVTEILQSVTLHDLEKEYQEYIDYGQDMYYI